MSDKDVPFGPTGRVVYERTYSRTKPDGSQETWPETVERVIEGNLSLVYGDRSRWPIEAHAEAKELRRLMRDFKVLPAGRHLWASGVKGRQYLFNCHAAGWGDKLSDHFEFTFLRLMEGGGVGSNYSTKYLAQYGPVRRSLKVHIVCDPGHPDYAEMLGAGLLSTEYDSDWPGAFLVEDSREGWAAALVDLIDTYMTDDEVKHENRVYDVTNVRPKGSRLKTFGGTASGPAPFARMMAEVSRVLNDLVRPESILAYVGGHLTPLHAMEIDHAIAECVVSGGNRRSARMSIVRWDDPFIEEFIACKTDTGKHWTTNISVEVDDDFLALLRGDDMGNPFYGVGFIGDDDGIAWARRVHAAVVEGMLTNGEPGYWNSSRSNVGEVGEVITTNPCGEIALEPWENCNLGHVNLDAFADPKSLGELVEAHRLMTRFLIRATFGDVNDAKQRERLLANRRIGVGHFGVQGYLAKRGIRFSEAPDNAEFRALLRLLYKAVRDEARDYAFRLRIPEPVKVTTIAPTGTIAKMPGATEGIHPIFARYFIRRVRFNVTNPEQAATVEDARAKGYVVEQDIYDPSGHTVVVEYPTKETLVQEVEDLGYPADLVESADELSVDAMLRFQRMYQEHYADNAVSFTVNVTPETAARPEEVARALAEHLPHLKGTTIMVDGTRPQAPYERITREDYEQYATFLRAIADSVDDECATGACPVR